MGGSFYGGAKSIVAPVLQLVRASVTFRGLPLRSSDVVRAWSAKASIACQNIASAVAVLERAILAVPVPVTCAHVDQRAPWSLCALRVSETEAYGCSRRSHQNRAYHHLSNSMQELVITPRWSSLFQYVVAIPVDGRRFEKNANSLLNDSATPPSADDRYSSALRNRIRSGRTQ